MKKIGEIKEEFAAASEGQWADLCAGYAEDQRSGVQTDFAVRKENKGTGSRKTPHGADDAV